MDVSHSFRAVVYRAHTGDLPVTNSSVSPLPAEVLRRLRVFWSMLSRIAEDFRLVDEVAPLSTSPWGEIMVDMLSGL